PRCSSGNGFGRRHCRLVLTSPSARSPGCSLAKSLCSGICNWLTRAKAGCEQSLGQRRKCEPLWPVAADHFFQNSCPILHRIGDDFVPRCRVAERNDWFARDDLVFAIAGPDDEERIDWCLGSERKNKGSVRQKNLAIKEFHGRASDFANHTVALNRNDLATAQSVSQIECKRSSIAAVADFDRACARLLQGKIEVCGGERVRLGRSDQ